MLGRELAASFDPLMQAATNLARRTRERLEQLGPEGQDRLAAAGGAAAVGFGAFKMAGVEGVKKLPAIAVWAKALEEAEGIRQIGMFHLGGERDRLREGRLEGAASSTRPSWSGSAGWAGRRPCNGSPRSGTG
ncbi:MAG: hypothetical protein QM757_21470 [Paludibaculum sp.]